MKRKSLFIVIPLLLSSLSSCGNDTGNYHIFAPEDKDAVGESAFIDDYLKDASPLYSVISAKNSDVLSYLYDVTPSCLNGVCELYRFRFNIDSIGSLEGESFLVYQNKAYQLGGAFGGYGVTHYAYDSTEDKPLLYFIYSYGSGAHRSLVNAFDFSSSSIKSVEKKNKEFWNADLQFSLSKDKKLQVLYSTYDSNADLTSISMSQGEVVYEDLSLVALV